MIKFKMVKPFIYEFVSLTFVVSFSLFALLYGDFIEITFNLHFVTVAFIIISLIYFFSFFSRIVNLGSRALFDYAFQKVKEDKYVFLKEIPYQASSFTEKFERNGERSVGMYYLIVTKKGDDIYTFISPVFCDLTEGNTYTIITASSSHIVLSCIEFIGEV